MAALTRAKQHDIAATILTGKLVARALYGSGHHCCEVGGEGKGRESTSVLQP